MNYMGSPGIVRDKNLRSLYGGMRGKSAAAPFHRLLARYEGTSTPSVKAELRRPRENEEAEIKAIYGFTTNWAASYSTAQRLEETRSECAANPITRTNI